MNLLYYDIKMVGRNRQMLFSKLKRHKIKVLKVKSVDEKQVIVRVYPKDIKKVFAFFGDMWYNEIIKISPVLRLLLLIKKRYVFFVGILLSIIVAFYINDLYFGFELRGDTIIERQEIEKIISTQGVNRFYPISQEKIDNLKDSIFSLSPKIGLVFVKKVGNRLIIEVYDNNLYGDLNNKNGDIVSPVDGEIYNIITYRGRPLKNIGDSVKIGETVIKGEYIIGENAFPDFCQGIVVIKKQYTQEFVYPTDNEKNVADATAIACFYAVAKISPIKALLKRVWERV